MDDQQVRATEDRLRSRLRELRSIPVAPYAEYRALALDRARPTVRPFRLAGAVAAGAAVILVAALLGSALGDLRRDVAASPSPSPTQAPAAVTSSPATSSPQTSPSLSPSPTSSPTASPGAGTVENRVLGYRLTLSAGYRRAFSDLNKESAARSGVDLYVTKTEAEARAECDRDAPHIGGGRADDVRVAAHLDTGLSALEWATTPQVPGGQPLSQHQRVQQLTVNGHQAVRLVPDRAGSTEATIYVIRANDRIYEIGPTTGGGPSALPAGWLDGIAQTFTAIQPDPFPTPAPAGEARESAQRTANALADAFAARDAAAVRALMPECWIAAFHAIDGQTPGMGPLNRAVSRFVERLRDAFARGALSVTVRTELRSDSELGRETYYVRSEWSEEGRTVRADLFVDERDGRWIWWATRHQFTSAEIAAAGCALYPSPWREPDARC